MFAIVLATSGWAQQLGPNLVVNGDFEGEGGWATNSSRRIVEVEDAPGGSHVLMMNCEEPEYYFAIAGPDVPIEPRTLYRISLKIKRVGGGGHLRVGGAYLDDEGAGLRRGSWGLHTYPINLQPGEATRGWHGYEGHFITGRTDAAALAFRIIIKYGVDTAYIDDVAVQRVERPPAAPLELPASVIWQGRPSAMGMRVEDVVQTDELLTIVTSGARMQFDADGTRLSVRQRIPEERPLVRFEFEPPLGDLRVERRNDDVCALVGEDVALSVNPDGLIALATNREQQIRVHSQIGAEHFRLASDNLLAVDDSGGFCVYPEQRLQYDLQPSVFTDRPEDASQPGWQTTLTAAARKRVALGVFPPRPYPWEQSFEDRIAHSNDYPSDEMIRWMAQYCNILVLHQGIYEGASSAGPYIIEDDDEYARVIATAHDAGMEVLPYFNPGAYTVKDVDKQLELLRAHRERYGTDGFYFDGLGRKNEWPWSYYFIRHVREMVGDACIYTHSTLNPPANSPSVYCPFIDTYSDFQLRGEGQVIEGVDDPYLRWVVSTWNISNSIPTLKGDKMEGTTLKERTEAMLDLHGRARWPYPGYREEVDQLFTEWYFPTLDEMEARWRLERGE
jgi:hypothetical protein